MSTATRSAIHRGFEAQQAKAQALYFIWYSMARLALLSATYPLAKMIGLTFGERPADAGALMLEYLVGLLLSLTFAYVLTRQARQCDARYGAFNGMLPPERRSPTPDTPFWRKRRRAGRRLIAR